MWKADIAKAKKKKKKITKTVNNFHNTLHHRYSKGSEYASVSDFEYVRVLNMPGLHRVLNMPEKFLNISEYAWICQNMYECA